MLRRSTFEAECSPPLPTPKIKEIICITRRLGPKGRKKVHIEAIEIQHIMKRMLNFFESLSKRNPETMHPIIPPNALIVNVEEISATETLTKSFRSRRVGPLDECESPITKNECQRRRVLERRGHG